MLGRLFAAPRAESKLKMLQSSRALNESFLRFLDLCAAPNKKKLAVGSAGPENLMTQNVSRCGG
jgi:hypothetical protein